MVKKSGVALKLAEFNLPTHRQPIQVCSSWIIPYLRKWTNIPGSIARQAFRASKNLTINYPMDFALSPCIGDVKSLSFLDAKRIFIWAIEDLPLNTN